MANQQQAYTTMPLPPLQRQMIDWLGLMHRRHAIHALIEFDVTETRAAIRAARRTARTQLSLTAYVIACLAQAIAEDRRLHAYRRGKRLVLFADIDVTTVIEQTVDGQKIPVPHIIRAANRRDAWAIQREIARAQAAPPQSRSQERWLPAWLLVPPPLRRLAWAWLLGDPFRRKRLTGTVIVTAVGMFGTGTGWGIPLTDHTLCLTLGGITRKPGLAGTRIEPREYLCATITADHDLIDGAPLGRFIHRLKALVEGGGLLAIAGDSTDPAAT